MSTTSGYYFAQAEIDERAASRTALGNVRECHLRSARAWRVLAERLQHAEAIRADLASKRALVDAAVL
ncbi:hypothetical protein [Sphingomonas quercus]|uniref:Uncharacterized protein n=1 Tax=Sphingomonas quercus TaxID=2842451 RepID=A0ABS6BKM7_9SPHN|nr:hypothetical protein [Sphingomonas quercus]MBU3078845.1 hypothetical protein [Sphingomonas quercus]